MNIGKPFLKYLLVGQLLGCSAIVAAEESCSSVIELSKVVNTTVQDQSSVDTHSKNFCDEYSKSLSSGKSMNASASYKFLSASFGKSSVSAEDVSSRYCSAENGSKKRDDAYKQYVESISPLAYSAYESCLKFSSANILFSLNVAAKLPKELSINVSFKPNGGGDKATFLYSSSEGTTCSWAVEPATGNTITLQGIGSAVLNCKRANQNAAAFVKVTRSNGIETITFPWPKMNDDGETVDSLKIPIQELADLSARFNSIKGAVVPFAAETCPQGWSEYSEAYGRFIRGIDKSGEAVDPAGVRKPGDKQDDLVGKHSHLVTLKLGAEPLGGGARSNLAGGAHGSITPTWDSSGMVKELDNKETRPKNIALLYCKKD